LLGDRALAVERIGGHHGAFQGQHPEQLLSHSVYVAIIGPQMKSILQCSILGLKPSDYARR
jgi:hypothetical protein